MAKSKEEKAAYARAYRLANLERVREIERKSEHKRSGKKRVYARAWWAKERASNPEKIKERKRLAWRDGKAKATQRKWIAENTEHVRQYRRDYNRAYQAARKKSDPQFALLCRLRDRLCKEIKRVRTSKSGRTVELLGCSLEVFKGHIKKQFKKGMSWKNYGRWELDHVVPCSSFDLTKPEHQRLCFHYTNLRPLWRADNREKRARITQDHQLALVIPVK